MAVTKEEAAISAAEAPGDNVVPFGPRDRPKPRVELTDGELEKLRKMMRQFDRIVVACPTARREAGE